MASRSSIDKPALTAESPRARTAAEGPARKGAPKSRSAKGPKAPKSQQPRKSRFWHRWPRWAQISLSVAKWGALALLALLAAGAATVAILFLLWGDVRAIKSVADYRANAKLTTRVISADGELIGEIYDERRTLVEIKDLPRHVIDAFLAAEDADFFSHGGLDYMGMARALYKDVIGGGKKQGGSTITQQVAKTFYLTREKSLKRKVKEIVLARRLESALTKEEILFLYLNQIYFGHGRYGLEEAARYYFGHPARELAVGEAAMLAGMPKSPNEYSPLRNPAGAKSRQRYVLRQMEDKGFLPAAIVTELIKQPIQVIDPKRAAPYLGTAPEVVDEVRRELVARHGAAKVPLLGVTVRVSVNARLQQAAREALESGLREIDARHGYAVAGDKLKGAQVERRLKQYARAHGGKLRDNRPYPAVVVSVDDAAGSIVVDLGGVKGTVPVGDKHARYNRDDKPASVRYAANDVIWVRKLPDSAKEPQVDDDPLGASAKAKTPRPAGPRLALDLGPQGALVVIDPQTRKVLALVGGYSYRAGDFNRATQAKRQPGSAFKAFVYAAALASGTYTPATVVNDAPEVYALWKPQNSQKDFKGPVRLRQALAQSINTIAIRLTNDVGTEAVRTLAQAAGIESELTPELSLALGASEVTPLELTNAYATFAAGGYAGNPTMIEAIGDEALPPTALTPAIPPDVTFVLTSMLESVVKEGTGKRAQEVRRPVAGKTGTSNDERDAWFIGYTPDLVAGVWVGFDEGRSIGEGEAGGKTAVPIWVDVVNAALKNKAPRSFKPPLGIVKASIDAKTGKLAAPGSPGLDEYFVDGTQPTEVAPAAGAVAVDTFVVDQAAED